ncbi:sugar O-acetyltransferase [Allomuricauda sp. XS_ASV26]|uniref:sugar O-acetyltransferase n=1 Tax=Allomuricauda sp. XS_ASV26 TaxID=3241292 RepID=UPI0035129A47
MNQEKIVYQRNDKNLQVENNRAKKLIQRLNRANIDDEKSRIGIILELFGKTGKDCKIEDNFHCDIGSNIEVGKNFYGGYNLVISDIAKVTIGDNCMIAPNVGIYTAGHSISPKNRNKYGYAKPISIGDNVWIGGNCTILPGVLIGDNSVIAAGSVVTKNVAPNIVVAGNPAKKIKDIEIGKE